LRRLESIILIATGRCNLRCPYCYASVYAGEVEAPLSTLERVAREAGELGVEYVNVTGGEPLLRRDIVDVLRVFRESNIEVSLFTNLHLMRESTAREVSKYVDGVLTTIDGPREVYERVKGAGSWERFLEGLKAAYRAGLSVHANITISKLNYSVVDRAVEVAVELGVDSISVIPAMPSGRALETKTYVEAGELVYALKLVDRVAEEYGLTIPAWCTPVARAIPGLKRVVAGNCRDWGVMDVTPSGRVIVCDIMGVPVADVVRDGVWGSWVKLSRYIAENRVFDTPSECSGCSVAALCRGGCYARAHNVYGRLPAPDPLCPLHSSR